MASPLRLSLLRTPVVPATAGSTTQLGGRSWQKEEELGLTETPAFVSSSSRHAHRAEKVSSIVPDPSLYTQTAFWRHAESVKARIRELLSHGLSSPIPSSRVSGHGFSGYGHGGDERGGRHQHPVSPAQTESSFLVSPASSIGSPPVGGMKSPSY
eukprot:TRINITY_DN1994_c0_g1_i2.p1 TRINITY_DN1994_c0_g1~~TRINITY_DN1994_c0_g1_i2.p1  ORF type:complete len:155 (+),score=36.93 TRINITY_DN1994_c0_g1_i2:112-576(+)